MKVGTSDSEFAKLFTEIGTYRENYNNEVRKVIQEIENLGKPRRESDVEACKETMRVLNFLDHWTQQDGVVVIMRDEC